MMAIKRPADADADADAVLNLGKQWFDFDVRRNLFYGLILHEATRSIETTDNFIVH